MAERRMFAKSITSEEIKVPKPIPVSLKSLDPVRCRLTKASVYFIQVNSFVKIGYSINPKCRCIDINTMCPYTPRLLLSIEKKSIPDAKKLENELHLKFNKFNKKGEWFKYTKEIKEYIKGNE